MLIGLMSLPNQVVYIQFHPVAYMVKLNIEMSMASLITRLARGENSDEYYPSMSHSNHGTTGQDHTHSRTGHAPWAQGNGIHMTNRSKVVAGDSDDETGGSPSRAGAGPGIHRRTDIEVKVETDSKAYKVKREGGRGRVLERIEDELPLTSDTGHPKQVIQIHETSRDPSMTSIESGR